MKSERIFLSVAVLLSALGFLFFLLPIVGLAGRVPWSDFRVTLADPLVGEALRLSLVTSLLALLVAIVFGAPMAWLLARHDFFGRRALRTAILLPMVLPPVVAGVGLLAAFGRRGLLGPALEEFGISLSFTTTATVMAQAFVATPFLVLQLEAGLLGLNRRFEAVAEVFGASRFFILRRVILPQLAPALGAGMAVTWARALGEFGATITFAGNLEGVSQTMPLAVYLMMEQNAEAAYLIAFLLLLVSFVILFFLRGSIATGVRGAR